MGKNMAFQEKIVNDYTFLEFLIMYLSMHAAISPIN